MTAARIVAFQAKLRAEGKSEATIGAYSRHLKAALRWAVEIGMLQAAPKIRMPKRAKGAKAMKGRPINTEEYERLLMATSKVVGEEAASSWKYYLVGLWWSGLCLAESLVELYWEERLGGTGKERGQRNGDTKERGQGTGTGTGRQERQERGPGTGTGIFTHRNGDRHLQDGFTFNAAHGNQAENTTQIGA